MLKVHAEDNQNNQQLYFLTRKSYITNKLEKRQYNLISDKIIEIFTINLNNLIIIYNQIVKMNKHA